MKLSIVIPAYNCGPLLYKGLQFLARQDAQWFQSEQAEIIVVDDGSSDGTSRYIERIRPALPKLRYMYRPRDEHSGRSCARNTGLREAAGEYVCFLDAGMLVPPNFVSRIFTLYEKSPDTVTLHNMYGIDLDPAETDISVVEGITPDNIGEIAAKLSKLPAWKDRREPFFLYMRDDIQQLALPWELGYSGAITVPARTALAIGGFDESYKGWGVEDIDFAYRLHREGMNFRSDRQAYAIHYPHGTVSSGDRQAFSDYQNRLQMHTKFKELETELFPEYQGHFYGAFIEKMNTLQLPKLTAYSAEKLDKVSARTALSSRTLLIGADDPELVKRLDVSHIYVHNRPTLKRFRAEFPSRVVEYSLGLRSYLPDKTFELCIVTDMIRVLHPVVRVKLLRELTRISGEVILLLTAGTYIPEKTLLAPNKTSQPIQMEEALHEQTAAAPAFLPFDLVRSPRIRHVMEPLFWCGEEELRDLLERIRREKGSGPIS
ncbi:glycosyltransferase family 2 protein [Paenibacillus sp. UNC499MF]|uniref:glycosyltransferase family 2 protein n=1 Tax=Paenibacillus sp. UNC499MF TaxID=1502751 RepID=UPI0008A095DF|nr:glycosyltransferase family 2 protein [Paenibacillus sp. UNC499MF]SEG71337.1 Glycosyltransferase involved in cell wall bisynthesis [Paenibacillus sp. UNC499MF]